MDVYRPFGTDKSVPYAKHQFTLILMPLLREVKLEKWEMYAIIGALCSRGGAALYSTETAAAKTAWVLRQIKMRRIFQKNDSRRN